MCIFYPLPQLPVTSLGVYIVSLSMATFFGLRSSISFASRHLSSVKPEPAYALLRRSFEACRGHRHASNGTANLFAPLDTFSDRHIGPNCDEASVMLSRIGYSTMEEFVRDTVPPTIRVCSDVISNETIAPLSETELFQRAKILGKGNKIMRSYIGMGYHNAVVPPVILRNVSGLCQRLKTQSPESPETISRSSKTPAGTRHIHHINLR